MNQEINICAGSALTVLNAIKYNYGAAIGIDIPIEVIVRSGEGLSFHTSPKNDFKLLQACIQVFKKVYGVTIDDVEITTKSSVPAARELKTSSAVSCALITAFGKYYEQKIPLPEVIALSAQASLLAKVSITGAIDDAYASFCGGLAYTNTRTRELLSLQPFNTDLIPILLVPAYSNPKGKTVKKLAGIDHALLKKAHSHFKKGDVLGAIQFNTQAYGPFLLRNFDIVQELSSEVKVIGLNGAGPSLFALSKPTQVKSFKKAVADHFPEYKPVITSIKQLEKEKNQ
ncbi:MAG: shikimate kinase [Candidatus Kariarchaeaceae archaeon]|jgi:shikimate kinase